MNRYFVLLPVLTLVACSHSAANSPVLSAADAGAQVRQAEIDFAKAFSDRDEARFVSMIDPDAYFLGPRRTLRGTDEIMSVWSTLIREDEFTWAPERVVVSANGGLGLSTGPVRDRSGKVIGQYSSVWQRQPDGSWKVLFDGPGSFCPPPPPAATTAETRQQYLYVLRVTRPEMLTAGPTEQEMKALEQHVAYLQKLTDEGVLLAGGRTQNNDPSTMGLAIFLAPSDAAAIEIMKNDPAVRGGMMTATLYPYHLAFGKFASPAE